jgi:hypothetical protein
MGPSSKAEEKLKKLRFHLKLLNAPILTRISSRGTPYLGFTLCDSRWQNRSWRIYYRKATKSYKLQSEHTSYEFKGNYSLVGNSIVKLFRSFP